MSAMPSFKVFCDGIVHGLEPQPCGVQVVEWAGLVTSGFQFLLGLAAVFAEEVGDFLIGKHICYSKRCHSFLSSSHNFRIYIRTF